MLREHVSFAGEAFVARAYAAQGGQDDKLLVQRLRLYLSEGWSKWRMALRMSRMTRDGVPDVDPATLDISLDTEVCLQRLWDVSIRHFEDNVVAEARRHGHARVVAVVDGNLKNRRSCCAAPFQHILRNELLGRVLRLPCQHTALLGSPFCKVHKYLASKW